MGESKGVDKLGHGAAYVVTMLWFAQICTRRWPRGARERLESGKATILGVVLNDRKLHIPVWIYRRL